MFCRRSFVLIGVLSLGIFVLPSIMFIISGCSGDESDPTSSITALPDLVVAPQTVVISSMEGSHYLERVHVRVDSEPYGEVSFRFNCESSWMTVSNLDGTELGVTRDSFSIIFDLADLVAGEYVDSVMVASSGSGNSPQYIEVTCSIAPIPPDLAVEPQRISFTAASLSETPPPESLHIRCADGSNLSYSLEESADWITLSGSGGVTPDTVEVMVDITGLATGSQVDTITVSSEEMWNSPLKVVCSLYTPSWQLQEYAYSSHALKEIVFADENIGWAAGYISDLNKRSGYLLRTVDGGANWETARFLNAVAIGDSLAFVSVDAIGSEVWAITERGVLYYSANGGAAWENIVVTMPDPGNRLRGTQFVTTSVGWIMGTDGLIMKTTDGGGSWVEQTSGTDEDLLSLSFIDEDHGWIIGLHKTLLLTVDGGDNWVGLEGPIYNCRDVFFVDANRGWIVGSGGYILRTDDGGYSWDSQESGIDSWLQSVHFVDNLRGSVTGENGVVLYTDDAGETWQQQVSGTDNWLRSVFFYDELRGWVAGECGEIRYTTSGGQ